MRAAGSSGPRPRPGWCGAGLAAGPPAARSARRDGHAVHRAGLAPALAGSGAFDEVRELPGGRVYLRATAALADFEEAAVGRAFRVLAPVLLPGRPDPERVSGMRARLVLDADADADADARDFQ